jgi:hypothetical protein
MRIVKAARGILGLNTAGALDGRVGWVLHLILT